MLCVRFCSSTVEYIEDRWWRFVIVWSFLRNRSYLTNLFICLSDGHRLNRMSMRSFWRCSSSRSSRIDDRGILSSMLWFFIECTWKKSKKIASSTALRCEFRLLASWMLISRRKPVSHLWEYQVLWLNIRFKRFSLKHCVYLLIDLFPLLLSLLPRSLFCSSDTPYRFVLKEVAKHMLSNNLKKPLSKQKKCFHRHIWNRS